MRTELDKDLAKKFIENKEVADFVIKELLTATLITGAELEGKTDKDIGETVRARLSAQAQIQSTINKIKQLAQDKPKEEGDKPKVPK